MSRILIIDDDDRLRGMLAKTLRRAGYEVTEAVNGEDGLLRCREIRPAAVITDIVMPEKEGLETIVDLRTEFPDMPIVAMSGGARYGSEDYLHIAGRLGAAQTLHKPFQPADLLEALRSILRPVAS